MSGGLAENGSCEDHAKQSLSFSDLFSSSDTNSVLCRHCQSGNNHDLSRLVFLLMISGGMSVSDMVTLYHSISDSWRRPRNLYCRRVQVDYHQG